MIDQEKKDAFVKEYGALCKKYNIEFFAIQGDLFLGELDTEFFEYRLKDLCESQDE